MEGLEPHSAEGQSGALPYMKNGMGFWWAAQCSAGADNRCAASRSRPIGTRLANPGPPSQPTRNHPEPQGRPDPSRLAYRSCAKLGDRPDSPRQVDPEKLLAGTIPDVLITVDAGFLLIPTNPSTTHGKPDWRFHKLCCHQKMDPLGFPSKTTMTSVVTEPWKIRTPG